MTYSWKSHGVTSLDPIIQNESQGKAINKMMGITLDVNLKRHTVLRDSTQIVLNQRARTLSIFRNFNNSLTDTQKIAQTEQILKDIIIFLKTEEQNIFEKSFMFVIQKQIRMCLCMCQNVHIF